MWVSLIKVIEKTVQAIVSKVQIHNLNPNLIAHNMFIILGIKTCTLIPVSHVKVNFIICSKSSPKQTIRRWLMGCRDLSKDMIYLAYNNIRTSVAFCIQLKKNVHI
jgi:hypothetical protein